MGAIYLNTDLNLRARFDLSVLHEELVESGFVDIFARRLHGVWESTYEIQGIHRHPSQAIERMLDVVNRLSPESVKLWKACVSRRFNLGFECSDNPYRWTDLRWTHTTWQLKPALLRRMADVDASFVVTIYPPHKPDGEPATG